jgi:hypothetical protein
VIVAQRITRLMLLAGGVVLPTLAEAAASFLAPGRTLTPGQRLGLQQAAHALAEGREQPVRFCVRAAEICGEHGGAAASLLDERLSNELPPQPGMPSVLSDPALTCEMRLVSDYPAVWLLPALGRSGLAGAFSAAEISYVADLGGFSGLFDTLIAHRVISPGHTLWVDYHSPRTSEALRKGVDAAIFVDARRLRRDLALWRLVPLPT